VKRKPVQLTHLDSRGNAHMVDVGHKETTRRVAVAEAVITMNAEAHARMTDPSSPKGDVLAVARIAGIQAAKRTPELIPLCHVVPLSRCTIDVHVELAGARIVATAEAVGKTGVEMEALTAASVAALALYDMLKAVDKGMGIRVGLLEKRGGKSGDFKRPDAPRTPRRPRP